MKVQTRNVAAVVIPYSDNREKFLVAKRSDSREWEFPGGKFRDRLISLKRLKEI